MSKICSACGTKDSSGNNMLAHPILGAPICNDCNERYHDGHFTVEENNEIYCRWCGEGDGELLLCDSCPKSFCSRCIGRNFGTMELTRIKIMSDRWNCLICSPHSFTDLCMKNGWTVDHKSLSKSSKSKVNLSTNVVCPDISRGRERYEIPAVNEVDTEPAPLNFTYVNQAVSGGPTPVLNNNPDLLSCCDCTDGCRDATKCECLRKMGGGAYDDNQVLLQHRPAGIFECSARCACHIRECTNRVVQHGPHVRLEVFKCANPIKGWGVRCRTDIPAGTYVADYIGEIMVETDGEKRGLLTCDQYLFNMDYFGRDQASRYLKRLGLRKDLTLYGTSRMHDIAYGGHTARDRVTRERERIETDVNVTCMTRKDLLRHLDRELVDQLERTGAISRALESGKRLREEPEAYLAELEQQFDAEVLSGGVHNKNRKTNKLTKHIQHVSTDIANGLNGGNNDNSVSSSSSSSGNSDTASNGLSWAENQLQFRLKMREEARNILTDRKVLETEDLHGAYVIDARWYGSVARFFNHACSANLDIVSVFCGDTQDPRMPRVALFTACDVSANTELCYDYGYRPGNVEGKGRECLCGSENCRKSMY